MIWATQGKFHSPPLYRGGGRNLNLKSQARQIKLKLSAWPGTTKRKWQTCLFVLDFDRPYTFAVSLVLYIDLIQLLSNFTGPVRTLTSLPSPEAHTKWTSTFLMRQSGNRHWLLRAQRRIWGLSHTLSCICWRPCKDIATVWGGEMYYVWGFSFSILFDSSCESLGAAMNNL